MALARIAAFDFDGTLIDGQSGSLIVKWLTRRRLITPKTMARCTWWGIRYTLHMPFRQNEVREIIFSDLARFSAEQVHELMECFHNDVLAPRYKQRGIDELRKRMEEGYHTVLISATFDQIAQVACEHLGCETALATIMERDEQGRFTGNVVGKTTEGQEKVERIRLWADETFGKGEWELSCAYGDHHSDEPMLSAAKVAYAVDPGPMLRREADRRGWQVLEWEK